MSEAGGWIIDAQELGQVARSSRVEAIITESCLGGTRLTGWRRTQAPLCFVFFCGCGLCVNVFWCSCFMMYGTLIWCLLWAPLPVRMLLFCILFSARRSVLECQCQPFSSPPTCFSHMQLHGFQQGHLFAEGERCNCVLLQYSRAQLFKMTPEHLTLDLISHLHSMQISVDLPRKRPRQWGRRKQKQSNLNEHLPPVSLS